MTTTETTIPLGKLVPSKSNVRRITDKGDRAALAASIEHHGLIQNLVVRKAEKGNKYEVVAGGRRLDALTLLMKEGRSIEAVAVTKDYPVRVVLKGEGSDTEISLAENVQRVGMHPVDEITAYRELAEQGAEVENIAARFGQSVVTVRQRLKLASLSPRILDVMRENEITLEQARALAISDDHEAQEKAWFEQSNWNRDPRSLRAFLTQAHVRATDRLARFVGLEAYEQAGGGVLRDLFAEDATTYLTDRPLLVQLASGRLEVVAEELRQRGWKWAEVSLESNISYGGGFGRIHMRNRTLEEAEQAELDALDAEFDALAERIDGYDEGDPQLEADEQRQQEVSARIDAIQSASQSFDPQEVAVAGCLVGIGYDGTLEVVQGLVKPEDQKALAALRAPDGEQEEGDEAESDEEAETKASGLSASLVEELTAIRTAAMRVELVARPEVALAAMLMPLLSRTFHTYALRSGMDAAVEVRGECLTLSTSIKEPDACRALSGWNDIIEGWSHHIPGEPADLWPWLLKQEIARLLDLLAVVTAANLNAVTARYNASRSRLAQADGIGEAVGLDMQRWWEPGAPFLARLSKADIADILREVGCAETAAKAVERSPKDEAVALAEKELAGKGWLPMPLRGTRKAEPSVMAEAAE
ncbi:ParB/RepB/Spo0J family partition protein [Mesorhizobium sp. M2D.F.Ca.ET.185.01.1.1]|uniref:ParB/RepB/Spo0J family partition protein n=2 Tax=Mesorhizobium TaxID=68287 RepID=UPI000FCBF15E|nr:MULTISPECIES: ParB/RepB/Spo0J family partition protein [unclassified Mesorhizobium]TGP74252.1 ParB/RepB/Spo0J family partition protein [bacterium M00.F.Ca.ET.227.01.1.1]TGU04528.1 ParB/RepB/Spo0J family partition protein [bacterium M00.F.Ca.ET.163.01.1.1]TGU33869.1 ParB/RepB/Spo0J family partition protein [bacterium M00.F.Ca.ET.156.01.1.1]TGU43378.1 ParB/RepB/Spo0J family partition protein [bacterium M00.F.Ca.ET.146.01.1.1]TGW09049.1 ParB/RepB/Spo0J family partition protein [Mesorhizobium s